MIIYKNNNKKLIEAFSIRELLISIIILWFAWISLFQIYNTLENQKENLDNKITSIYFSEYLSNILRKSDIPENLNTQWVPFYIIEMWNEEINFSRDPIFLNTNWWFQKNLDSRNNLFSQEIFYIEKNTIDNVDYYQYKINSSFNWVKNTTYITK